MTKLEKPSGPEKQININVPETTKLKIDEMEKKINAVVLSCGKEAISKGDFFLAGVVKFLTDNLGLAESMDWAKRKAEVERLLADIKAILEKAYNV